MSLFLNVYRRLMARPQLYRFNLHLYKLSLRALGVLNAEGSEMTGESWFLKRLADRQLLNTVVDVGANTGTYTQEVLLHNAAARVISCEPHPLTFAKLKKNLKHASRRNVRLLNVGLSNKKGKARLWDFADSAPGKSLQPTSTLSSLCRTVIEELHEQPAQAYSIQLDTLDHLVKQEQWKEIDLLKIDTEGFELQVLQGAQKLIAQQRIRVVQLEFNEMQVFTQTFVRDVLQILPGYRWYRLLPYGNGMVELGAYRPLTHELFGFQNLVALAPTISEV